MEERKSSAFALALCLVLVLAAFVALTTDTGVEAAPGGLTGDVPPKWQVTLPSKTCPDGSDNCSISSPTLADLTNDNKPDIVVGTNNGHVLAVRSDGAVLWDVDTAPYFNMSPGTQEIASSPSVADIDRDGRPEIAVGTGTTYAGVCTHGGVIVLEHDGKVKAGWPRFSLETTGDGCRETIYSSPALGDLTNDGYLEIVAGGFDKRIYVWRHDGSLLPGYPPDSNLAARFPTWGLEGRLADTVWSSPSLVDLDGDGHLDILIGTDEGNFDDSWGGDVSGWSCPYTLPPGWPSGYCGGSLYALDRFGNLLPGFPRYFLEIIQSSPAVADVNEDGSPEIFVGTGTYYYRNSPDHPTYGFRLFGLDRFGNDLPGWSGGKAVGGPTSASPVIGDIAGDGKPEIVVGAKDHRLYAWHINGQVVSGFPMKPIDRFGNGYPYASSFVLADYDGDNKMEVILNQASTVAVIDGDGRQLTRHPANETLPDFRTLGATRNSPAVADLDGNGRMELVANNSVLYVWEIPSSNGKADWPMFKRDAAGASYVPAPPRLGAQPEVFVLHDQDNGNSAVATLTLENLGDGTVNWSASAPDRVSLSPSSGAYGRQQTIEVTVDASQFRDGTHDLGDIVITATSDGEPIAGSPQSVAVRLFVGDLEDTFLPAIAR